MTFAQLVRLEPRLKTLEADIRRVRDDRRKRAFCANHVWYGPDGFKGRLLQLVGWHAANERLRSPEVYDLAYEHLYNLLPDCRNCLCGVRS